jgi:hypothetical protein
MTADLKASKEKSKSTLGYNSIKEFEHGKDEFKGRIIFLKTMVFEKAKIGARGSKTLAKQTYSFVCLKAKL